MKEKIKVRALIEKKDAHISFDKNKDYHVTKNFNPEEVIGKAKLMCEEEGIFADMEIDTSETKGALFYPAIGFMIKKFHIDKGVKIIDDAEILGVGLCANPNVDESIKPIKF